MNTVLFTDFTTGLLNNKWCGTGITEGKMIEHLKKINKSNGYMKFSVIVDEKYLKYVKGEYDKKPVEVENSNGINYKEIYKNSVIISKN
tara:strand:- start:883 stop:1149 length:267 start_codon:yes stop_codon:yes gene_type:complete